MAFHILINIMEALQFQIGHLLPNYSWCLKPLWWAFTSWSSKETRSVTSVTTTSKSRPVLVRFLSVLHHVLLVRFQSSSSSTMLREFLWLLNLDYSLVTSDSVVLQSLRHQLLQRLLLFSQREFSLGTPPPPTVLRAISASTIYLLLLSWYS